MVEVEKPISKQSRQTKNYRIMLKGILEIKGITTLNKKQQANISGGNRRSNCPIYTVEECTVCGGGSLPNGCCKGSAQTLICLTQFAD